jgi:hypothetical protein
VNGLGERNERPFLTLSQAAKRVGKSKATISKAIADGRLSVANRDTTGFKIDPAELFRVFTPNCSPNGQTERNERASERGERPQVNTPGEEIAALRAKLEATEHRLADKDRIIDDYRRRLDQEAEERRRLTLLLTGPTPAEKPKQKRSWWQWYWRGDE